jgi:hypothetical protein
MPSKWTFGGDVGKIKLTNRHENEKWKLTSFCIFRIYDGGMSRAVSCYIG